jgi:hypothetical protein
VLQFFPSDPSETELMARFAKIGVGAALEPAYRVSAAADVRILDQGPIAVGTLFLATDEGIT